ncbi:NrtA/SsuA/CpmA family ABC transporter substrate-binding protein [Desulfococcaceae bacterium HSG9]|nr:NrtA/SsuA/CpmA family ABC transporter substrate-binding protein [Desulfococcaceae bacterium HSG9]
MKPIHWKIIIIGCVVILGTLLVLYEKQDKKTPPISTPNPREHPVYSKYKFNKNGVIRIGVQPLYLPASLITEAFKRDTILKDALSKMGLEIRFYDFLKGDDVNFFLRRGDLDAGIGGDMPALTAAATLDIVVPVMIQRGFVSIVANRQMLIDDLRGERIGYAFGSNAHYALLKTLASAGLDENHVDLIHIEVNQMPDALHAGKISAFSAWEPTPTVALKKYTNCTVIHKRLSFGFFYFLKTVYRKHPEAVTHILAAEIRALRWMQDKRENLLRACDWSITAAHQAFGTKINLSVDEIAAIALNDILGQTSNPGIAEDDLKDHGPLHQELKFLIYIAKVPSSALWTEIRKKFDLEILNNLWLNQDKFKLDEFKYKNNGSID